MWHDVSKLKDDHVELLGGGGQQRHDDAIVADNPPLSQAVV